MADITHIFGKPITAAFCGNAAVALEQPSDAERFIDLLAEDQPVTFQTFDDNQDRKQRGLARIVHGDLEGHQALLERLQKRGAGVWVTVNATDLAGRSAKNITRVRAVFADLDGAPLDAIRECGLEPHCIVESSPGKYHVYWLVDGLPLDEFSAIQTAIAQRFDSDPSVKDLPRVMRLPGFYHQKVNAAKGLTGEPFQSRIIECNAVQAYSADTIRHEFPVLVDQGQSAPKAAQSGAVRVVSDEVVADLRSALNSMSADDRYRWVRFGHALHELGDVGRGLWLDWSQTSDKWKPSCAHQWDTFNPSNIGIETIFHEAQAAGWVNPRKRLNPVVPLPPESERQSGADDEPVIEPLLDLPGVLGMMQKFIYGRQVYPDMEIAGIAALSTLTLFTQTNCTVDSYGGLGLNEQYMVLAPTGAGKESIRKAIRHMYEATREELKRGQYGGNLSEVGLPTMYSSAPASKSALHKSLEDNRSLFYMTDEFAEWLARANGDPHAREALGYSMELYTSALAKGVSPSHAVTRNYEPVDNPRVSSLATSTPERMVEGMSASQADSGAFNRWVIHLQRGRPQKRYEGFVGDANGMIAASLAEAFISQSKIGFDREAWELFVQHDQEVLEPLKNANHALAGRLNEQAFKLAALMAISQARSVISADDLARAYAIREGIYHRTRKHMEHEGAFSDQSTTGLALEQVADLLEDKKQVLLSQITRHSRKYKELSVAERDSVIRALCAEGRAALADTGKHLVWTGAQ